MVMNANLCVIEDAPAIVGADHCVFAILAKVCSCDQLGLPVHFIPQCHFFVRNVPESELPIQGTTQEVSVILKQGRWYHKKQS